jgi:uncharacterized protein YegL
MKPNSTVSDPLPPIDTCPLEDTLPRAFNLEPTCIVTLIMDVSASTKGAPINAINDGLNRIFEHVKGDSIATSRCLLNLVTFGGDVNVEFEGSRAHEIEHVQLYAQGRTPMGEAINVSLDLTESQSEMLSEQGIPQYTHLTILLTDGAPTDFTLNAINRIHATESANRVSFFAVGVSGADMKFLNTVSSKRNAQQLSETNMASFFEWISNTLTMVSQQSPDGQLALANIEGWANI